MGNILGISDEELRAQHQQYHAQNPSAPRGARCLTCKREKREDEGRAAAFILKEFRADPILTVQELALVVERRPQWVRNVLKANDLIAPERAKAPWIPKSQRPCANCHHLPFQHCKGRVQRRHVQNAMQITVWPCPLVPHCRGTVEISPSQEVNCSCQCYTTRVNPSRS